MRARRRCLKDVHRPGRVDMVTGDGVGQRAWYGRPGREVDDGVGSGHQAVEKIGVENAALDEFRVDSCQVVREPCAQIIKSNDLPHGRTRGQFSAQVGPDESGASGHKNVQCAHLSDRGAGHQPRATAMEV